MLFVDSSSDNILLNKYLIPLVNKYANVLVFISAEKQLLILLEESHTKILSFESNIKREKILFENFRG